MKRLVMLCGAVAVMLMAVGLQAADNGGLAPNDTAQTRPAYAQILTSDPELPGVAEISLPKLAPLNYIPKRPGHYSAQDWRNAIDSTWGQGSAQILKQAIWDMWLSVIDSNYSAFVGLSPNVWDSLQAIYSPEIADVAHPISKGRFAAILDQTSIALRDVHARAKDTIVDNTALAPGVPILVFNWLWQGEQGFFGAGLTTLPDSTALVYQAVPDHPLGLVPGDVVLGYDRIPWSQLFRELLEAQLPMRGFWGTSDKSFDHIALMSSGMNWHLFDTIDVVKYATGDTVHLPTSLMIGKPMTIWATEQLEVPGVTKPNFYGGQYVSWGIIEGTTIGYIYVNGWATDANVGRHWYNAIDSLVNHSQTTGIIIDSRLNTGANFFVADTGTNVLFDSNVETFRMHSRCNAWDHFAMCRSPYVVYPGASFPAVPYNDSIYMVRGSCGYHKPIAVLLGPASMSGGDFHPAQIAYHPMAKVFGKPSAGAFGSMRNRRLFTSGFQYWLTINNAYKFDDPTTHLTRKGFPDPQYFPEIPFQEVWLTRDGVAQGRDDVVEAAKAWILSRDLDQDGIVNENDNCPEVANVDQADFDHDGIGDLCDSDVDGDGTANATDNCPSISNPTQADANSDGIGDACCCVGVRGNVNYAGIVDLGDLSALVSYLTGGGYTLPCPDEANVNGAGIVDLADLSALVSYLTGGGYVLPSCS